MTRQRILQALAITSAPPFDPEDFLPATQEEKEQIDQMNEATTYWKDAWRRLKKNKIAMGALVAIIALILFAVVGPFFSPYSYSQQIRGSESLAPSLAHPFGTNNLGRDLLVRTMIGCRISLPEPIRQPAKTPEVGVNRHAGRVYCEPLASLTSSISAPKPPFLSKRTVAGTPNAASPSK